MGDTETRLRGNIRLDIPDDGTRATIHIDRTGEGAQELNPESVLALVKSRNVVGRIPDAEISSRMGALLSSREPTGSFEIAAATSPKSGTAESSKIEAPPIPNELLGATQSILDSAGAPEIYLELTENVKTTRIVTKKPALPFLPARKTKVPGYEKRVTRQRVYVDANVAGVGWAKEGERLGAVIPAKPGEPGRDVFGRPIAPPVHPDPLFYVGSGVERRRDELIATTDGVARWGRNWIEVIPFRPHRWSVSITPDRATCVLSFNPGHADAPPPAAADVVAAAVEAGYPESLLLPVDRIDHLLGLALRHGSPLERVPLCEDVDARIEVRVAPDGQRATLHLRKGRGRGAPLRLKEVGRAITEARLKGLTLDRIRNDINAFVSGSTLVLEDYLLAAGTPPRRGADGVVELSVRPIPEKELIAQKSMLSAELKDAAAFSTLLEKDSAPGDPPSTAIPPQFPVPRIAESAWVQKEQRILSYSEPAVGEPGVNVHGAPVPGAPGAPVRLGLYGSIQRRGNIVIALVDGMLDRADAEDGSILLRVRPHRDAEVRVSVAQDRMSATISVTRSEGWGRRADGTAVDEAVARAQVKAGIDSEVLKAARLAAAMGDEFPDAVFARGKPAQGAGDREFRFVVEVATGKGVRIRADGTADYRNQDRFTRVAAGDSIAEVLAPAGLPQEGFDVLGTPLRAGERAQPAITPGANVSTREEADGRTVFVARKSGEIVYENGILDVRSSHTVSGDVDLQSGNIKFSGPVTVTGSVRSGFYVMATGEVRVGGGVEAALVSSDENILIREGVQGAGRAVLRSKKSIAVAFSEQAVLLSVGDIIINNACLNSRVKCNGKLLLRSDRGTLLGGVVQARNGVEAQNLGSKRGTRTHIAFGQNYLIADQVETESKAIEALKIELARVEHQLELAEHHRRTEELAAHFRRKTQIMKLLEKRNLKVFTLREKFEEHFESEIRVRGMVFPGTVIESHGRQIEITAPKKGVVFTFNTTSGRIEEKGISQ